MINTNQSREYFYNLHDIECNQKYNKYLPYSFHLDMVEQQYKKFLYILQNEPGYNGSQRNLALIGCQGHDSIEDARIT